MNNELVSLLFKTNAFKICEENKPFWYTSGKIGPYFINSQYLYGSDKESAELLEFIDKELVEVDKTMIPIDIFEKVYEQYENNEIYRTTIDTLKKYIETHIDVNYIDYVSGGERRDWFFSIMIAYLLGKPHITIYKDLTTVVTTCDFEESNEVVKLEGQRVLHVADLLNTASSYERAWIPAIRNIGSDIFWSAVVVDRMQGGSELLEENHIESLSIINIDVSLFTEALNRGIINENQLGMLKRFEADPDGTMKEFLLAHPNFIKEALSSSDSKAVKRANLCIEKNIYGIQL
jgi:orotate phosphoribosyltransferase